MGELFAKLQEKRQIKDIILMYEATRKPRSAGVIAGSNARRDVYQMRDGVAQQKRDHELMQAQSSDWYPDCIENPDFQSWHLLRRLGHLACSRLSCYDSKYEKSMKDGSPGITFKASRQHIQSVTTLHSRHSEDDPSNVWLSPGHVFISCCTHCIKAALHFPLASARNSCLLP